MTAKPRDRDKVAWLPLLAPSPPPEPTSPLELRLLPKLGTLLLGISLLCFAAYYSGKNSLAGELAQTRSTLALQQSKAKQLNDQLYDANQQLQQQQQAVTQLQAVRAIVCPSGVP